jgi:uncharacterized protein YgiM (DUF1202 family)
LALSLAVFSAAAFAAAPAPGTPSITLPATAPAAVPATAPAPVIVTLPPATSAPAATTPAPIPLPASSTAAELPAVTQPFVASITGDKVYVRSGADQKYYEIGQLVKGDLVYIIGTSKGWYQILPPNGSFCMISKEFVELDPAATGTTTSATGTIKGDYVNVHAGTAINKDRDPYAIVAPPLRKGTHVKILGSSQSYYEIAPPDKTAFFVSGQFVKATTTDYKVPQLKLPSGAAGPTGITVEAPTTMPTVSVVLLQNTGTNTTAQTTAATNPSDSSNPALAANNPPTLPPLVPAVIFSETATARFNEVNARYQSESKKAPADQNLDGFLKDFKDILAMENISPSVKAGTEADLTAIDRTLTVQRLVQEQTAAQDSTKKQSDALREQYESAEKAIAAAREAGPYSAEGRLQTSTIVTGKYALVNPQTGRVVAYVDPSTAAVDVGTLIGKYVGVRGITKRMEGSDINVIQVSNATLMPEPH